MLLAVLHSSRPGTAAAALRARLGGQRRGGAVTLLAPTDAGFERLARQRKTTPELLRNEAELGDILLGHVVEGQWPLAALRLAGVLETLRAGVRLAFVRGEGGQVCVCAAGVGAARVALGR